MANRKDLGNVKLLHPRSGIETDRWRDIRHCILKVRIKMPHMIGASTCDGFRESCFAKNYVHAPELRVYSAYDDSITIVTNANNGSLISVLRLHHIQLFRKSTVCRQLGQRTVSGDEDQKIERSTSFHLKLPEEMESHMTFYLGRNSTTIRVTQKQDMIEKRCRFNTCLRSMISSRRGIKAPQERQFNNLMKPMNWHQLKVKSFGH